MRRVVLDDALGIGAELEADMVRHVESYQCEWAATLDDPERLARFVSFVNSPEPRSDGHPCRDPRPAHPGGGFAMRMLQKSTSARHVAGWAPICAVGRLTPDRGVAALVDGRQVAVFWLSTGTLHAVDNVDPCSGAAVISRGIVGDADGTPTIASPLYKQRFDLRTGRCLDADVAPLGVHDVAIVHDIRVRAAPSTELRTTVTPPSPPQRPPPALRPPRRRGRSAPTAASAAASCSTIGTER